MTISLQKIRAIYRFSQFHSILNVNKSKITLWTYSIRTLNNDGRITIDGITKIIPETNNPELIPKKFCKFFFALFLFFTNF